MHSLSLAVMARDSGLVEEIREIVADGSARLDLVYGDAGQFAELLGRIPRVQCDCVLLEPGLHEDLPAAIEAIKSASPGILVVAVRRSKSPEDILEAVRAGADEYLYPPLAADLRGLIQRLRACAVRQGQVVGLLGAHGGGGCTTVALNLAAALARLGKHALLLDAAAHGMVEFLANANCDYTLADAASNLHRMDADFWKRLIARLDGGLELLAAPRSWRERAGLGAEQLRGVLAFAARRYDFVVCDFGSRPAPAVAAALPDCSGIYLVSTSDVPAIYQSRQVVQMAPELGLDATRIRVVLNRMTKDVPVTLSDLGRIIGRPVAAALPEAAREVRESHADRRLLGASPLRQKIEELARALAGMAGEEPPPPRRFLPAALSAALKPSEA